MNPRTRIKMCGVTRMADAMAAIEAGVDALGFIFVEKSPRCVDPELAREIIAALPPFVDAVGVFVDRKRNEVEEIVSYCRLSHAQLHGEESVKFCERLGRNASPCRVIKAFRVRDGLGPGDLAPYDEHVCGYLLDSYRQGQAGGTGETFDWSMIEGLRLARPLLLAGGLDPDNVGAALRGVAPFGVDVNSGVELGPGVKDHELIRAFVQAVRDHDQG